MKPMRAGFGDLMIELTGKEKALASRIDFNPSAERHNADSWKPIADAMSELMGSLLDRGAIPVPRRKYFTEPFIGGHGRSHVQVFEANGTRGDDIFRHPHFVKYLRYFLYGPNLPKAVIDAFRQKVIACGEPFTGSDALQVAGLARQLTRSHGLDPHTAPEEFYKLALDCGFDRGDARAVRDSVMKVR